MDEERRPLLYAGPRAALLRRLGQLTLDDLQALDAAVLRRMAERPLKGRVDRGFWFAWNDGIKLSRAEQAEITELFSAVLIAIASGLTGLDVERFGARLGAGGRAGEGGLGGLFSVLRPRTQTERRQEAAIGLINDAAAPLDPRLGLMACWNVACAAAVRRLVKPATVDTLEVAWRDALGEPPA